MSKIKYPLYAFIAVVMALSCNKEVGNKNDDSILFGLASPVTLSINEGDTTHILLQDYFINPALVDSVSDFAGFKTIHDTSLKMVHLVSKNANVTHPGNIRFWVNGNSFDIPVKHSYQKEVKLAYPRETGVDTMQLTGDINGWNPKNTVFKLQNDSFIFTTRLSPGRYGYQLVKNGKWGLDDFNPNKVSNGMGGFNSVLEINALTPEQIPSIATGALTDKGFTINQTGKNNTVVTAFINNHVLLPEKTETVNGVEILTFLFPENSSQRSHIRIYCHNDLTSGNDLLIPLDKGKPVTDASHLNRNDLETNIMYFLIVDRFANGDKNNDYKMDTNIVKPKAQYMGGDLKGLLDQIKSGFFTKMGITAIWISPITQNPMGAWGQFKDPDTKFSGYHGYWPVTLTTVDTRFGDRKTVDAILDEAHKQGINVYLDYVAHHLHIEHPVIKNNPNWVTPLYLPDGTMNTERWDDYRLTTWFDTFMPTLNLMDQKITDYMVDSALFWVRDVKFDGFRHDATKHIPLNFWRTLTKKIKTEVELKDGKKIYQIGETYGNNALISSYVNTGMLDAQFDFNLYDAMLPVFTKPDESFSRLSAAMNQSFNYYGYHHLMGNITGNQDKPRFISYADGSITSEMSGQDTKRLGWKQTISVKDSTAYRKLLAAQAFNLTIPGIPVIYYGDEFGMPGANDPDNRRMMKFSNLSPNEAKTNAEVTELVNFRRHSMALLYGDFKEMYVSKDVYAYSRTYFNETVWVLFNKSNTVQPFTHPKAAGSYKTIAGSELIDNAALALIEIKPNSFTIIQWKH